MEVPVITPAHLACLHERSEQVRHIVHTFSPNSGPRSLYDRLGTPTHARAQAFLWAINNYRDKYESAWRTDDIQCIAVSAGPAVLSPAHWIRHPNNPVSAQYSVPFSIAAAIAFDLRNPLSMSDDFVNSKDVYSLVGVMTSGEKVTPNSMELGAWSRSRATDRRSELPVESYPGLPRSKDYTAAIEDKFKRAILVLGVEKEGAMLREKVL